MEAADPLSNDREDEKLHEGLQVASPCQRHVGIPNQTALRAAMDFYFDHIQSHVDHYVQLHNPSAINRRSVEEEMLSLITHADVAEDVRQACRSNVCLSTPFGRDSHEAEQAIVDRSGSHRS